jgi:DNA-binding MarR family transcriptional regulator
MGSVSDANDEIEQQLLLLLRRTQSIHVRTSAGEVVLDRSSYGILCLVLDEGPQRLGTIAQTFTLDPSTITRQVQAVVKSGLAEKTVDVSDRRAMLLSLTDEGRVVIGEARRHRRAMLQMLMKPWTEDERREFGRALRRFNTTVDEWNVTGVPESLLEQS